MSAFKKGDIVRDGLIKSLIVLVIKDSGIDTDFFYGVVLSNGSWGNDSKCFLERGDAETFSKYHFETFRGDVTLQAGLNIG